MDLELVNPNDYLDLEDNLDCKYCDGDGYILVDVDYDSNGNSIALRNPRITQCPFCEGSGLEADSDFEEHMD